MKNHVKQILTEKNLLHLWSEENYNTYKRKSERMSKGNHLFWKACAIADMIILNELKTN